MNLPAIQFYPGDWLRDPQLRMTTPASRGIWFDLLCHMWNAPERGVIVGTADQLQRLASCSADEFSTFIGEIETLKFGDLSRESNGQLRIVNRRMVRDEKARKDAAIRQRRHRQGNTSQPRHAVVTPPVTGASQQNHNGSSSSSSPSKKETNNNGAYAPLFLDGHAQQRSAKKKTRTGKHEYSPEFEIGFSKYPSRPQGNPKPPADRAWQARIADGVSPAELIAGVERYATYVRATGTSYIMQAFKFFGPDEHWKQPWGVPPGSNNGARPQPAPSKILTSDEIKQRDRERQAAREGKPT